MMIEYGALARPGRRGRAGRRLRAAGRADCHYRVQGQRSVARHEPWRIPPIRQQPRTAFETDNGRSASVLGTALHAPQPKLLEGIHAADHRPQRCAPRDQRKLTEACALYHGSGARLTKMVCGPAPAKEMPASTRAASIFLSAAARTSNWQPGVVMNLHRNVLTPGSTR